MTLSALIIFQNFDSLPVAYSDKEFPPPLKQIQSGWLGVGTKCNDDLQVAYKKSDWNPVCIKTESMQPLIERNWLHDSQTFHITISTDKQIYQRHESISITLTNISSYALHTPSTPIVPTLQNSVGYSTSTSPFLGEDTLEPGKSIVKVFSPDDIRNSFIEPHTGLFHITADHFYMYDEQYGPKHTFEIIKSELT